MKGLTNVGNTCYLNAALQCLLHTPALTNYVLSGWAAKDVNRKKINAGGLTKAYIEATMQYWTSPEPAVIDTRAIWTCLCKLHKPFGNMGCHDAHEALALLLRHVHEGLTRTPRIEGSVAAEHVLSEPWEAHIAHEGYSLITEVFVGQTERVVEAAGGTYASSTHEHFAGLSLGVEDCASVSQALLKSFAPERLDGFVLEDGTPAPDAMLTKRLVYAPLVLVLHLKRFTPHGAKEDRFVDYALTMDVPGQGTYDLFGVCLHANDHYVALCEVNGTWRCMDDATVQPVDVGDVISKDAYVLLYKKRV